METNEYTNENRQTSGEAPSVKTGEAREFTGRSGGYSDTKREGEGDGRDGYKREDGKPHYRPRTRLPFKKKFCFFTRNHITYIDYKDTLLLKRFLGRSGQILSPRITGVKPIYQRKLALAVKRARYMGLIPYVGEIVREDIPPYRSHDENSENSYSKYDSRQGSRTEGYPRRDDFKKDRGFNKPFDRSYDRSPPGNDSKVVSSHRSASPSDASTSTQNTAATTSANTASNTTPNTAPGSSTPPPPPKTP